MTTKFSVASLSLGLFLALQCNVGDASLRDFLPKQLSLMTAVVERLSSIEEVVKKVYKAVNEGNEVKDLGATPGKEGVEPNALGQVPGGPAAEGTQQGLAGAGQVDQQYPTAGYPQQNSLPVQGQLNDQTGQQGYNQQWLNNSRPEDEQIPVE